MGVSEEMARWVYLRRYIGGEWILGGIYKVGVAEEVYRSLMDLRR